MQTFEQAEKFLEKINEKDKVAIVCHDDLDGFASGILFYDFCIKKGCKDISYHIFNLSQSKLENFQLEDKNIILIADLGPNVIEKGIQHWLNKGKKIFYTDHHQKDTELPKSKNFLELRTLEQGYIPSSRTVFELTQKENKEKKWLAISGVITDAGQKYSENTKFINEFLEEHGLKIEQYAEQYAYPLSQTINYFYKKPERAFELLQKIKTFQEIEKIREYSKKVKKEIDFHIKQVKEKSERLGNINFYYFNPKFPIKSTITSIVSTENPNEIYVFAIPVEHEKISLSARSQSGKADMIELLKKATEKIKDAKSGGHKNAAGGTISKGNLEKFKENLRNWKD